MGCDRRMLRLYAVTDRRWTGARTLEDQVEAALRGGVTCVQLREKALEKAALLREARALGALCRRYGVPFLVNDHVDIALECGADGVHVGQSDLAAGEVRRRIGDRMLLGVSVRSVEEARRAAGDGADYLGLGAVFPTGTKADAASVPPAVLRAVCRAVDLPAVAIGGIHAGNLRRLAGTGIDGVALISAIFSAADIEGTCRSLRALAEEVARP